MHDRVPHATKVNRRHAVAGLGGLAVAAMFSKKGRGVERSEPVTTGEFRWRVGPPLVAPAQRDDECYSVKDPSVVRHADQWHVFATIRSARRSHQIEYLAFDEWDQANQAARHLLTLSDGYFCAPQVYYFAARREWQMILQIAHPGGKDQLVPAVSTTVDLARPESWSKPRALIAEMPHPVERWIDFWIICDEVHAHLLFTSLDGKMWRCRTRLADYPAGWNRPVVALQADIFEASHTYRLQGKDRFITLVEAQHGSRRYYKAYVADRIEGEWRSLADRYERAFASPGNVTDDDVHWTDSYSHGELLRAGNDERMEIDPNHLQFLFQGVLDADMQGKPYGRIPWKLGLLTPDSNAG